MQLEAVGMFASVGIIQVLFSCTLSYAAEIGWRQAGGSSLRQNHAASTVGEAEWKVVLKSKALSNCSFASLALQDSHLACSLHSEVFMVDATSGEVVWEQEAFNPRGPIVLDSASHPYIAWTGSSSAAGFRSFDSATGVQRWQTFCPRSQNYEYGVGQIAVTGEGGLFASCRYWQSVWRSDAVRFLPAPSKDTDPQWMAGRSSLNPAPLLLNVAGGSAVDVVLFGAATASKSLAAYAAVTGEL
jgi:outer membrane protein assembly factor BamB